jgi:hypothetical protein
MPSEVFFNTAFRPLISLNILLLTAMPAASSAAEFTLLPLDRRAIVTCCLDSAYCECVLAVFAATFVLTDSIVFSSEFFQKFA